MFLTQHGLWPSFYAGRISQIILHISLLPPALFSTSKENWLLSDLVEVILILGGELHFLFLCFIMIVLWHRENISRERPWHLFMPLMWCIHLEPRLETVIYKMSTSSMYCMWCNMLRWVRLATSCRTAVLTGVARRVARGGTGCFKLADYPCK